MWFVKAVGIIYIGVGLWIIERLIRSQLKKESKLWENDWFILLFLVCAGMSGLLTGIDYYYAKRLSSGVLSAIHNLMALFGAVFILAAIFRYRELKSKKQGKDGDTPQPAQVREKGEKTA